MKPFPITIAQQPLGLSETLQAWRDMSPAMKETLLLLGILGGLAVLVLIWAVFFRKRRRRHHHLAHRHHHRSQPETATTASADESDLQSTHEGSRRKWRRRRRRDHRPRNPTLAETGGLPPLRPQEPIDPHV